MEEILSALRDAPPPDMDSGGGGDSDDVDIFDLLADPSRNASQNDEASASGDDQDDSEPAPGSGDGGGMFATPELTASGIINFTEMLIMVGCSAYSGADQSVFQFDPAQKKKTIEAWVPWVATWDPDTDLRGVTAIAALVVCVGLSGWKAHQMRGEKQKQDAARVDMAGRSRAAQDQAYNGAGQSVDNSGPAADQPVLIPGDYTDSEAERVNFKIDPKTGLYTTYPSGVYAKKKDREEKPSPAIAALIDQGMSSSAIRDAISTAKEKNS